MDHQILSLLPDLRGRILSILSPCDCRCWLRWPSIGATTTLSFCPPVVAYTRAGWTNRRIPEACGITGNEETQLKLGIYQGVHQDVRTLPVDIAMCFSHVKLSPAEACIIVRTSWPFTEYITTIIHIVLFNSPDSNVFKELEELGLFIVQIIGWSQKRPQQRRFRLQNGYFLAKIHATTRL